LVLDRQPDSTAGCARAPDRQVSPTAGWADKEDSMNEALRRATRLVVINMHNRILLFQYQDDQSKWWAKSSTSMEGGLAGPPSRELVWDSKSHKSSKGQNLHGRSRQRLGDHGHRGRTRHNEEERFLSLNAFASSRENAHCLRTLTEFRPGGVQPGPGDPTMCSGSPGPGCSLSSRIRDCVYETAYPGSAPSLANTDMV
jgi:hypothetical protein